MAGGSFQSGFLTAGVTSALGEQIGRIQSVGGQVVAAAVLGGVTSRVSGGSFANGAITAAFVHAYNHMNHKQTWEQKSGNFEALLKEFDGTVVVWDQNTGFFEIYENGELVYSDWGYAGGNNGNNLEGVNNSALESVANIGPLPRGGYMVGEAGVMASSARGFRLWPSPNNTMHGRDGFWVHGGNSDINRFFNSSQGCPIMNNHTNSQLLVPGGMSLLSKGTMFSVR